MKSFFLLAFLFILEWPLSAQRLTRKEKEILGIVDKNYAASLNLLEHTVNINSGTNNVTGVREVGAVFNEAFKSIGFNTQWVEMPAPMNRAGHLFAEHKGTKGKRLLLIGHLDTVFEPDSPFQSWTSHDSIAFGPGTNDMKGGTIIMLYALKALKEAGTLDDSQIIVALHGDEESSGDPVEISRKDLIEAAKRSDYALAFETATGFGYATIARRGYSDWHLKVTGKRAHSAGIFSPNAGAGAIYETSRILHEFYKQLPEQYLTFNPGIIVGGSTATIETNEGRSTGKSNVIAETAMVSGDLRFISEEQKLRAREK